MSARGARLARGARRASTEDHTPGARVRVGKFSFLVGSTRGGAAVVTCGRAVAARSSSVAAAAYATSIGGAVAAVRTAVDWPFLLAGRVALAALAPRLVPVGREGCKTSKKSATFSASRSQSFPGGTRRGRRWWWRRRSASSRVAARMSLSSSTLSSARWRGGRWVCRGAARPAPLTMPVAAPRWCRACRGQEGAAAGVERLDDSRTHERRTST